MELLTAYIEAHPIVRYSSGDDYEVWDDFINSDSDLIFIAASRRSGKTSAIVTRSLIKNDKDAVIIVMNSAAVRSVSDLVERRAAEMGHAVEMKLPVSHSETRLYINNHWIYIIPSLEGYTRDLIRESRIYFDEPEHRNYIPSTEMIRHYREELQAEVIMIGSFATDLDTRFKEFEHYTREHGGYLQYIPYHLLPHLKNIESQLRQGLTDYTWRREFLVNV